MKKCIASLFLCFTLLCPALTLSASADTTVYITDTGKKYHNSGCSNLRKSKIAISLTEAQRRGYAPCKLCNAPSSSVHTHSWNSGSVTTAATCNKTGVRTYTCTGCGAKKTEDIPKTTHKWNQGIITTQPTKTSDGIKTITCSICNAIQTSRVPAIGYPFDDIPSSHYAWTPAKWAAENKITSGTSASSFSPDVSCTRGQVVTFLWRANGCPIMSGISNPFKDIHPSDYYYHAVLWAVQNGITNGTSENQFSPDASCTRGQVVTFLWRADGKIVTDNLLTVLDVLEDDYYYHAVKWALKEKITTGMTPLRFEPNMPCTRGQVVTFLYRDMAA